MFPVKIISIAFDFPIARTNLCVPPINIINEYEENRIIENDGDVDGVGKKISQSIVTKFNNNNNNINNIIIIDE